MNLFWCVVAPLEQVLWRLSALAVWTPLHLPCFCVHLHGCVPWLGFVVGTCPALTGRFFTSEPQGKPSLIQGPQLKQHYG